METFFFPFFFYWCSKQKVVNQSEREKHGSHFLNSTWIIDEFMQQDSRKKKEDGKTLVFD